MRKRFVLGNFLALVCLYLLSPFSSYAGDHQDDLSKGQLIYVPAYSHIYCGDNERPFLLTVTLSIRNIDPENQITISLVDYYETQGHLLKNYMNEPTTLKPMESLRYIVPERDASGGSGANFLVRWHSESPVNPPIVETIMIGTQNQQGVSFTSRGKEILPTE